MNNIGQKFHPRFYFLFGFASSGYKYKGRGKRDLKSISSWFCFWNPRFPRRRDSILLSRIWWVLARILGLIVNFFRLFLFGLNEIGRDLVNLWFFFLSDWSTASASMGIKPESGMSFTDTRLVSRMQGKPPWMILRFEPSFWNYSSNNLLSGILFNWSFRARLLLWLIPATMDTWRSSFRDQGIGVAAWVPFFHGSCGAFERNHAAVSVPQLLFADFLCC